jgi:hypothetical protein
MYSQKKYTMKKLIVLIAFCSTAFAYAQGQENKGKDMSAVESATLQTKKMTLALALDDGQSKKAYALILSQTEKRKAAKKEKTGDKKPSKEERLKRINTRLDEQIAFQNEMKSILTATQFEEWRKMTKNRKMRGKRGANGGKKGRNRRHKE